MNAIGGPSTPGALRAPSAQDDIAGRSPQYVFEAKDAEDVAQIVRETGTLAVAPIGAGTMLGLGNPLERYDVAIRTRGLRRVVDYEPEDQVVVVEAGIALGELQAVLAEKKQRLAIDPFDGDAMTIGGMLATNAYGPSALRYGTLKDLIVGIEIVRSDGAIARAGGKVVKNVAGFDVSKLMVGSLGTLAVITKATFRLHPLPEASRTLAFTSGFAQVFPFVLALREAQLEPTAIVAQLADGTATIEIRFEGFGPGVAAQSAKCEDVAASTGVIPSVGAEGAVVEGQREYRLKATFPPSELSKVLERVHRATVLPALGVIYIDYDGPSTPGALRAPSAQDDTPGNAASSIPTHPIQELRALFESIGGTLVVERMPQEFCGKIDAWGTPPPSFALMRALKERFDPTRRLNPGRFIGGL